MTEPTTEAGKQLAVWLNWAADRGRFAGIPRAGLILAIEAEARASARPTVGDVGLDAASVAIVLELARAYKPRGIGPHTPNGRHCTSCRAMRVVDDWLAALDRAAAGEALQGEGT